MIHIITTGETIEGLDCEIESAHPTDKKNDVDTFFRNANVFFE